MKIVAFGDFKYKYIAHNWALHLHNIGIFNYTIYSLDKIIHEYLLNVNINTDLLNISIFNDDPKYWSWIERVKYISRLLDNGSDILHSDLDAIWLKNPTCFLSNDYDIIASTGSFPQDIFEKIGYTICMGWIFYKSSTITKDLLNNTLKIKTEANFDDQRELNRELFNKSKYKDLKLKIVDQSIVSREQKHDENTYVAHPLSPKDIDREKFLKESNLWILS